MCSWKTFQWKNLTSFIKTFDSLLTPRNQIPRNMMFGGKWMAYLSVSLNYWITLCEVNTFFHYFELIFIHVFTCMFDFWVFYPCSFGARSISITLTYLHASEKQHWKIPSLTFEWQGGALLTKPLKLLIIFDVICCFQNLLFTDFIQYLHFDMCLIYIKTNKKLNDADIFLN